MAATTAAASVGHAVNIDHCLSKHLGCVHGLQMRLRAQCVSQSSAITCFSPLEVLVPSASDHCVQFTIWLSCNLAAQINLFTSMSNQDCWWSEHERKIDINDGCPEDNHLLARIRLLGWSVSQWRYAASAAAPRIPSPCPSLLSTLPDPSPSDWAGWQSARAATGKESHPLQSWAQAMHACIWLVDCQHYNHSNAGRMLSTLSLEESSCRCLINSSSGQSRRWRHS